MPDLGPLALDLTGVNAGLRVQSRSFDDIYGDGDRTYIPLTLRAKFAF